MCALKVRKRFDGCLKRDTVRTLVLYSHDKHKEFLLASKAGPVPLTHRDTGGHGIQTVSQSYTEHNSGKSTVLSTSWTHNCLSLYEY